jgi:hypothetical protein
MDTSDEHTFGFLLHKFPARGGKALKKERQQEKKNSIPYLRRESNMFIFI